MKKTIIIIGVLGLVCICGLLCFVNHAQANGIVFDGTGTPTVYIYGDFTSDSGSGAMAQRIMENATAQGYTAYCSLQSPNQLYLNNVLISTGYDYDTGDPTTTNVIFKGTDIIMNGTTTVWKANTLYYLANGYVKFNDSFFRSNRLSGSGKLIEVENGDIIVENSDIVGINKNELIQFQDDSYHLYVNYSTMKKIYVFGGIKSFERATFKSYTGNDPMFLGGSIMYSHDVLIKDCFNIFYIYNPSFDFSNATITNNNHMFTVFNGAGFFDFKNIVGTEQWDFFSFGAHTDMFINRSYTGEFYIKNNTGTPQCRIVIRNRDLGNMEAWNSTTDAFGFLGNIKLNHTCWLDTNIPTYCYNYSINVTSLSDSLDTLQFNFSLPVQAFNWTLFLPDISASVVPTLDITENLQNCSVTHDYVWDAGLNKFFMYINGTSPLVWFRNIFNMTLTNESAWDGTNRNIYLNGTGNTTLISVSDTKNNVTGDTTYTLDGTGYHVTSIHESTLTQFLNLINAYGTHESFWDGSTWLDWANVTGNPSTGTVLLVDDPNPANGVTSYGTNFLALKSDGITTSVDISYWNFSILNASSRGNGFLNEHYDSFSSDEIVSPNPVIMSGQSFNVSYPFVLHNISLYMYKDIGATGSVEVVVQRIYGSDSKVLFSDIVSNGSVDVSAVPLSYGYVNVSMSPFMVNPDMNYSIRFYNKNADILGSNYVWVGKDTPGSYAKGSFIQYIPLFPTGFFSKTFDDICFALWSWVPGINISWDNVVNISFFSKSSGIWSLYVVKYAAFNCTIESFNNNFSVNDTQYWWSVVPEINGTVYAEQFYTFTTGTNSLIAVLEDHRILYLGIGGTLGGVLTMVCIPYIFIRRRRQEQETTT